MLLSMLKLPIAMAAASAVLCAQTGLLAVVEKKAGQLAFYSSDGKRLAGTKVGTHPHEVIRSADKKLLYVSDNGILWMTDPGMGGNTISVVDIQKRERIGVIDLGNYRRPHGMDLDPRTGRMVVTIENPYGLLLIDTKTRKVVRKYDVQGQAPHMVVLGPGAKDAYVSNSASHTIAVVNLESGKVKLIPTGERPQGGLLAPDGKRLYLTNSDGNSISVVDTSTNERAGLIQTGEGPGRVCMTPDRKTLVYNLQPGEGVGFADVATLKETSRISLPGKPLSLTMTADGQIAYAGLQDSDKIAVISVPQRKLLRVFDTPAGHGPDPVLPLE
jgi:YVTN family beta-propeller protein